MANTYPITPPAARREFETQAVSIRTDFDFDLVLLRLENGYFQFSRSDAAGPPRISGSALMLGMVNISWLPESAIQPRQQLSKQTPNRTRSGASSLA